ncbi:dihydrofolate reductase [Halopenitus malekzadehii]|uniref:dihydrofolate reductase n=1 Tax=Halopenitus malekzadehii TaxID=1267564 RepID=A0A1H6HQQ5_9EURY|nr:dihydrofolate reductase [Halopenitus malekzadehii]SEH36518.1 dihydrofolate reductase [Halopenitus malekzadehii]
MEIDLIAAVDRDGAIGTGEDVPWEYPEDITQYRDRIGDAPTIMGRRTFDQMSDPPGDPVIVLTRTPSLESTDPRVQFVTDPTVAIDDAAATGADRVFINGGEAVYRIYVPYATGAYVSEIPERSGGNVSFPYLGAGWDVTETIEYDRFDLVRYRNRDPVPVSSLADD